MWTYGLFGCGLDDAGMWRLLALLYDGRPGPTLLRSPNNSRVLNSVSGRGSPSKFFNHALAM